MLLGTAKLGSDGPDGSGTAAITGLSAAIVQVPAPGTAGILGRSFLNCFGAVEFDWRLQQNAGAMCLYQEYAPFDDDDMIASLRSGLPALERMAAASDAEDADSFPMSSIFSPHVLDDGGSGEIDAGGDGEW